MAVVDFARSVCFEIDPEGQTRLARTGEGIPHTQLRILPVLLIIRLL